MRGKVSTNRNHATTFFQWIMKSKEEMEAEVRGTKTLKLETKRVLVASIIAPGFNSMYLRLFLKSNRLDGKYYAGVKFVRVTNSQIGVATRPEKFHAVL